MNTETRDCDRAIDLFAAYLARELPDSDREFFHSHVWGCGDCHDKLLALEIHVHLTTIEGEDSER